MQLLVALSALVQKMLEEDPVCYSTIERDVAARS
jgi:hypothetical protein